VIWEKKIDGRWRVSSRDYFVGGKMVLIEEDIDENGVAGKLLMHSGDQVAGVLRKGNQITGVVPQAEIDEIIEAEKSGTAAGEAIGSIIGTGKNGPAKTTEEIAEDVKKKYEENRKK
jgi:hypothetical protein